MFRGEHTQKMDTKGRVVIPSKIRDNLAEKLVIAKGMGNDKCLLAYPESSWDALTEKINSLPIGNAKVRTFSRFFLGSAETLDADKQGRVLIPSALREHARLQSEVVWIGLGNRIEIWDKEELDAQMNAYYESDDAEENMSEIAEYMAELGI